jgi:hypothetical protein
MVCDTGFKSWCDAGTLKFHRNGVRLLKMHGSVDWTISHSAKPKPGRMPSLAYEVGGKKGSQPLIVFGEGPKVRYDGPFIDLLKNFNGQLRQADRLVIVGYSFRDDHVNDQIGQWLSSGPMTRHVIVIDPSFPPRTRHFGSFSESLIRHLVDAGGPQSPRFKTRLCVVNEEAGAGLARLDAWRKEHQP